MIYVSNAFSPAMLPFDPERHTAYTIRIVAWPQANGAELARCELDGRPWLSIVGHQDTAAVMSAELGLAIQPNRVSVQLAPGDQVVVGQYSGPRLPEGATTLPDGATIRWLSVEVQPAT